MIKPHSLLKSPFNTILFCIMSKMVIMTTAIVIMMAMMVYGKDDGRVLFFFLPTERAALLVDARPVLTCNGRLQEYAQSKGMITDCKSSWDILFEKLNSMRILHRAYET